MNEEEIRWQRKEFVKFRISTVAQTRNVVKEGGKNAEKGNPVKETGFLGTGVA